MEQGALGHKTEGCWKIEAAQSWPRAPTTCYYRWERGRQANWGPAPQKKSLNADAIARGELSYIVLTQAIGVSDPEGEVTPTAPAAPGPEGRAALW